MIITRKIADELGFKEIEKRQVKIGDGPTELYSYVGPVKIELDDRIGFSGALVNDSPEAVMCYLGSIVMSELDLEIVYEPHVKLRVSPKSIFAKQI
jgi:hypothetical protein